VLRSASGLTGLAERSNHLPVMRGLIRDGDQNLALRLVLACRFCSTGTVRTWWNWRCEKAVLTLRARKMANFSGLPALSK